MSKVAEPNGFSLGILAGGAGRRVGGQDKGWLRHRGEALIERVVRAYAPQADELLISANRTQQRYAALGARIVADASPDFPGPLAGILALLEACTTRRLVTLPVDLGALPADLLDRLLAIDADLVRVHEADGVQPLVACWQRALLPDLAALWQAGVRGVAHAQDMLAARGWRLVELDWRDRHLGNLNGPEWLQP